MHLPARVATSLVAVAAALTACSSASGAGAPSGSPSGSVSPSPLGSGFYNSASPPPPEGTVTPQPGSWSGTHPPAGYRVVLLTAGDDKPTRTLVDAVHSWAAETHVRLSTVTAASATQLIPSITKAIELKPDLIISAGSELVDPLATVTASSLHQQFLVIGAELAEPTGNVTAADWKGASFRGEGLGTSSSYDPASFTTERAGRAVRAGVAAVLNRLTGIVVWIS